MAGRITFLKLLLCACTGCLFFLSCVMADVSSASDGRTFELVSPVYKGGYGATQIEAVSESGGKVVYYSPGVFAGAPAGLAAAIDPLDYLAQRGATGWSSVPITAPTEMLPYTETPDVDPNLDTILLSGKRGRTVESAGQLEPARSFYWHRTALPDESVYWEQVGVTLEPLNHKREPTEYLTASPDFCHILVSTMVEPLLVKAVGVKLPLYEVAAGCHGEAPSLRLVDVNNGIGGGAPISKECDTDLGVETYDPEFRNDLNAVSSDGSQVFFTTCIGNVETDHQLFVRLDGSRTVEVSQSLDEAKKCGKTAIPCPGSASRANANFAGASTDGSRVYFTSTAELTGESGDSGEKLYMATIGCPGGSACSPSERGVVSLVQASRDPQGGEAGVKGVLRTSPDGSRVYFLATGNLLTTGQEEALKTEGTPVPLAGADNLYVYDTESGATSFIAMLCSGYELSGSVGDARCQSRSGNDESLILTQGVTEAQTAGPDGHFLVFSSYAQLSGDDGDSARDVYRYDAITGALTRVSGGEDGYHSNGNDNAFNASIHSGHHESFVRWQHEMDSRAISEDGSRIVFTTAEPLSKGASNGLTNVYEWHETSPDAGSVSLLSGGSGTLPVEDAVISPSGEDVFFVTAEGLASEDVDGADDIYDARLGGGFPTKPVQPSECKSDGCYGPLTNPAPLLIPGSATQAPEEAATPASPGKSTAVKSKAVKKTKTKAKGKAKKRSTKAKKSRRSKHGSREHVAGSAARGESKR